MHASRLVAVSDPQSHHTETCSLGPLLQAADTPMGIIERYPSGVCIYCMPEEAATSVKSDDIYPAAEHGYSSGKEAYLRRLKRIEGQVRGIARMVDEDSYCIDILTQVAAVNKALHALSLGLLEEHIGHCVVNAAAESDEAGEAKKQRSDRCHRAPAALGKRRPP